MAAIPSNLAALQQATVPNVAQGQAVINSLLSGANNIGGYVPSVGELPEIYKAMLAYYGNMYDTAAASPGVDMGAFESQWVTPLLGAANPAVRAAAIDYLTKKAGITGNWNPVFNQMSPSGNLDVLQAQAQALAAAAADEKNVQANPTALAALQGITGRWTQRFGDFTSLPTQMWGVATAPWLAAYQNNIPMMASPKFPTSYAGMRPEQQAWLQNIANGTANASGNLITSGGVTQNPAIGRGQSLASAAIAGASAQRRGGGKGQFKLRSGADQTTFGLLRSRVASEKNPMAYLNSMAPSWKQQYDDNNPEFPVVGSLYDWFGGGYGL